MSDKQEAVTFSQAENLENASQEEQKVTQPKYVTVEEARRLAVEEAETAYRRAQGLVDKNSVGIERRVQERLKGLEDHIAQLKATGVDISPEQEARMRQSELEKAFTAPPASEQKVEKPSNAESSRPEVDPVTAEAWQMMEEAGVNIEPTDIEANNLDMSSPYKFLKSVEAAIEAKKARISASQTSYVPTTPTNLGGTGGMPKGVEALTARLVELQKHPGKNYKEIMEVTAELEKIMP